MERTLVIIKPEAVKKKLVGKIISIYEDNHLNVIHAHKVLPTIEVLEKHYDNLKEKPFFHEVLDYMSSSEVMVMVVEGENAVNAVRDIHGATNPAKAAPGTIRYMFGEGIQENAVHGSESAEAAAAEIEIWRPLMKFED